MFFIINIRESLFTCTKPCCQRLIRLFFECGCVSPLSIQLDMRCSHIIQRRTITNGCFPEIPQKVTIFGYKTICFRYNNKCERKYDVIILQKELDYGTITLFNSFLLTTCLIIFLKLFPLLVLVVPFRRNSINMTYAKIQHSF